jgi:hypothetical protein
LVPARGDDVADAATPEPGAFDDLGPGGRRVRSILTAAAAGLLLYGTLAGGDDMFPFGPFHMYSRYYPADGTVSSTSIRAVTADGRDVYVTQNDIGIARGAIEGRLPELVADPNRLAALAAAHQQRHPDASPYVELRIVQTRWHLEDRRLTDQTTVTLVEWQAP